MNSYKLTVNKDLEIISLSLLQDGLQEKVLNEFLGLPYNHVFPKIIADGCDVVGKVLFSGMPLSINDYQIVSFCGEIRVNIDIQPIHDEARKVVGAEILLESCSDCSVFADMQREHLLISIGKNSAALAHGVRNPLNAIKGAVVYLKEKFGNESTLVDFAELIEMEILKLDRFISRFLSTSQLESEFVDVNVNDLIRDVLTMSNYQACTKNIIFSGEFGDVPEIKADPFQIKHAVMNIVNNSFDAMTRGGSIILKTGTAQRDDCAYVSIEISDTGRGIPQERSPVVSVVPDRNRKKEGRGFGLFITREIIQYHGGHLEISSKKNLGTRVKVLLPVKGGPLS